MKKITLSLLLFAVTCFTFGQTTVTKTYTGPTVTVDGCGSYCVTLPGVTFTAGDFAPGCTTITDVQVSIDWLKTDGTCGAPGTGNSFHNETNFRIDGPSAQEVLAVPGTWTGAASSPPVTTVFDQSAGGIPVAGTPVNGTFLPNNGNLDNFNGSSALGTWALAAGDTAGADPLCVIAYSVTITVGATNDTCATSTTIDPVAGGTISGDTTCATDSGVANCAGFSTSPDVWYSFTDTSGTGMVVDVNTCSAASTFDTVLNVYTGSCGALVCVGGDDDDPSCATGPFAGLNSRVPFVTDGSSTYWVKVNGFSSASGAFDLNYSACVIAITCPADVVVSNDPGACEATGVVLGAPTTNACPGEIVSNDAPAAFPVGLTVVTWTVTDASGTAVATCTQNVTVNDTQDPLIGCPAPITTNNDPGVCGATVTYGVAFGDNCPGSTLAQTAGQASGTVFPIGTTTNTFVVTDASGNTATCSFDVTVNDTEGPAIACPANITVSNDPGVCGATVTYATPVGTDNCAGSITTQTAGQASGTVFPVGTTTNTFVVTDASGNTATCSFDVTVNDTEDPTITCPADITVSNDPGLCSAVVNYTITGTDNCATGTSLIPGQTGTFTGLARGYYFIAPANFVMTGLRVPNSASSADQNVQVMRFASIPANFPGTSSYDALLHWSGLTPGNNYIPVNIPVSQGDIIGILGTRGTNSTNSYASGNPMVINGINVPINRLGSQTDIHLAAAPDGTFFTEPSGVNPNKGRIEFEYDSPVFTQTAGLASGSSFPVGTTTNTFVSIDEAGNTATCSFDVTVNDTEPPMAVCAVGPPLDVSDVGAPLGQPIPATGTSGPMTPSVVTVGDSGILGVDYNIGSVELDLNHTFDGDLDINLTSPMGTVLALSNDNGGSGNNYTGTIFQDGGANINVGSAPFTGIFQPEGGTFAAAFGGQDILGDWTLNINDQFGGDSGQLINFRINFTGIGAGPVVVILDGTGNASITVGDIDAGSTDNCGIASTSIDITDFTCADIGINIVTLTVTDVNGNVSTCTSEVLVVDDQPPVAVCMDITVQLDANGMASIVPGDIDGGSTDNCAITLSASQTDFTCADVGVNIVTLTVTDEGGNVTTCTANVTVEDNVPPVAICNSFDVFLDATGNVSITAGDVDGGSNDACGIASTTIDIMDFTCADIGPNNVTLTVTDNNGNVSTCIGVVTVIDDIYPIFSFPACQTANTDPGLCSAVVVFPDAIALDNCAVTVAQTGGLPSGSAFPVGVSTIEYTATDEGGNTAVCTFTITVTDNELPVAVCQDITIQLDANGDATITAADIDGGSTDNCGVASLDASQTVFDCSDVGPNNITLTVTDVNGNVSTCIAVVTVEDNVDPVAVCMNITVELDVNGTVTITPADIDGGSSDACGIASLELDVDTFTCADVGENTVTLTVTDNNGNVTSCTAIVTVEDNIAPDLVCMDITVELDENGEAQIVPEDVMMTNTDACGILTTGIDIFQFDCDDIGTPVTVTVFSQDNNGNLSSCTAVVTVVDLLAPVVTCPADITVDPGAGNQFYLVPDYYALGEASATDNCTDPLTIFGQDPAPGTLLPDGVYTVTMSAEDEYGNVGTCTFELTVESILGVTDNGIDISTIVMYPNPAINVVNISNPQNIELEQAVIYDVTGRLVQTYDLKDMGTEKALDISMLSTATYVVMIQGPEGQVTKQLIKE